MIKINNPILWDGHLIQSGKKISLPSQLEKSIVSSGNGEFTDNEELVVEEEKEENFEAENTNFQELELSIGRGRLK